MSAAENSTNDSNELFETELKNIKRITADKVEFIETGIVPVAAEQQLVPLTAEQFESIISANDYKATAMPVTPAVIKPLQLKPSDMVSRVDPNLSFFTRPDRPRRSATTRSSGGSRSSVRTKSRRSRLYS